ncbi:MAG: sulfur transferase domain-containing protein [Acidobacteriota bacterium]
MTVRVVLIATLFASTVMAQSEEATPVADSDTRAVTESPEPHELGTIKRLHAVDGIFLASQPSPADFELAKKEGVATVINLRHEAEITEFDPAEVVTALDLDYVHLPWSGPDELTDEIFDQARELFDSAERPILMHCGSANRVGALWIPWRVLDGGLSVDAAIAEAKTIGLKTPEYEEIAKEYIERNAE